MEDVQVVSVRDGSAEFKQQILSEEAPLTIEVNGEELATLLCSPTDLEDLTVGFLYTAGILVRVEDLGRITLDKQRWKVNVEVESVGLTKDVYSKRVYTSGCGKGILIHNPLDLMQPEVPGFEIPVEPALIIDLMKEFLTSSKEHKLTGGVHSCALASADGILVFKDDIGRHNALDKVIGHSLRMEIPTQDKLVLTSGRISSEILSKSLRARISMVVSAGAPTNQAVKIGSAKGMTLVGFARGKKFSIFSRPENIASFPMASPLELKPPPG